MVDGDGGAAAGDPQFGRDFDWSRGLAAWLMAALTSWGCPSGASRPTRTRSWADR